MEEAMPSLPLAGVVVVELSHTIMGPACGVALADLGADVIRIEPAPDGDPTRSLRGFGAGFFFYFNRNKRSICIDLKSPHGLQVARDLIGTADVLLENYGPGVMDRLGLGWDDVHALNPRLVYCELKGFLPGPYERRPALDELVQFMTGLAYMTGPPGTPMRAGSSVVDIMGGTMGALAVLAALRQRDRDGIGHKVTSALYETSAYLVAQHMAGEAAIGTAPPPMSARNPAWGVYETFPTADGHRIFVGIISDNHWRTFCRTFGLSDLEIDPRYLGNTNRVEHRAELRAIVTGVTSARTLAEMTAVFDAAGLPFAPVRRPSDLFDDPQMNVEGRMLPIQLANGTIAKLPPLPVAIDGATMGMRQQPAGAGEHTDAVLSTLGYDADHVARLREEGAIA
jgi:crotonobetainyl-CoA:carnitine CoA-transferase CaiB-like acyl-CoA transferase